MTNELDILKREFGYDNRTDNNEFLGLLKNYFTEIGGESNIFDAASASPAAPVTAPVTI